MKTPDHWRMHPVLKKISSSKGEGIMRYLGGRLDLALVSNGGTKSLVSEGLNSKNLCENHLKYLQGVPKKCLKEPSVEKRLSSNERA